jgi:hypothetical protein
MRSWWNGSEGLSIANWDKSFAIWIFLGDEIEVKTVGDNHLIVVGHCSLRERASKLLKVKEE